MVEIIPFWKPKTQKSKTKTIKKNVLFETSPKREAKKFVSLNIYSIVYGMSVILREEVVTAAGNK